MSKTIAVNVQEDEFIEAYLSLWATPFELTKKELEFLKVVVEKYMEILGKVDLEYVYPLILETASSKSEIMKKANVKSSHFSNIIKSLKEKGVFNEDNVLQEYFLPTNELTVKFDILGDTKFKEVTIPKQEEETEEEISEEDVAQEYSEIINNEELEEEEIEENTNTESPFENEVTVVK